MEGGTHAQGRGTFAYIKTQDATGLQKQVVCCHTVSSSITWTSGTVRYGFSAYLPGE